MHMKNFVLLLFHAFKELLTVVSSADSSLLYIWLLNLSLC